MELNHARVTTPPRPAATVVLLRDGDQGIEVLMLRRAAQSDVLGGAFVFPGGKLDEADSDPELHARLDTPADTLHDLLSEPALEVPTAAALFVAALRETFEESGILMAHGVTPDHVDHASRRAREGLGFLEVMTELGLTLRTSGLAPWSRWITPVVPSVMNKRFDTRFFIGHVPEGLTAKHDAHEATEAAWLPPREALRRYWDREIELAPPQIQSLAHLARYANADQAVDAARLRRPPTIQPEPFDEDGTRVIAYPGDPRHPLPERALPGPLRLRHRKGRFEPVTGDFASFFD